MKAKPMLRSMGATKGMTEPKNLRDKDPWMLAEDIPDIDFQFSQIWLSSFVNDLEKTVGRNYKKILCVYHGYNLKFYYGEKDSDEFAEHALHLMLSKKGFGKKVNAQIRKFSHRLKRACRVIDPKWIARQSNAKLARFYAQMDALHTELYTWGWLGNAVDMFHANFTRYLKSLLEQSMSEEEVNPAMVALTASKETTMIQKEHFSFLRIAALAGRNGSPAQLQRAIQKHLRAYFYLKHLWIGKDGVYDYPYYAKEISKFLRAGNDPLQIIKKEQKEHKAVLRERARLLRTLKLGVKERRAFDIYAELAVTKLIRRDAQIYWAYKMDLVFVELSRRLFIPFMQTRFMFPWEIIIGLRQGKISSALKKELLRRVRYCVYYAEKGYDKIFIGEEARRMEKTIPAVATDGIVELRGHVACLGKATGAVRIINSVTDMGKMQDGDILVSIATNPDIVPAMKMAAAIVTEQGGITSHAAIVSRELGIPCIIGTKIVTKVLKDGEKVEVDAVKGVVKKLS